MIFSKKCCFEVFQPRETQNGSKVKLLRFYIHALNSPDLLRKLQQYKGWKLVVCFYHVTLGFSVNLHSVIANVKKLAQNLCDFLYGQNWVKLFSQNVFYRVLGAKNPKNVSGIRDIYISSNLNPFTKFSSSSRSTKFKDILPWNISQMITKTISISTGIVISYVMKWGILLWIWWKVNGNWDNNMIRISQWRESHCRTNTSVRRKK